MSTNLNPESFTGYKHYKDDSGFEIVFHIKDVSHYYIRKLVTEHSAVVPHTIAVINGDRIEVEGREFFDYLVARSPS